MDETKQSVPVPTSQGVGDGTGLPPPMRHDDLPPECRNCLLAATHHPHTRECRIRLEQLFRNAN